MPLTYYGEATVAYPAIFGGVPAPANYWFGLQVAQYIWSATIPISSGQYLIPSAFDTFSTPGMGTNRIFVALTTGTTSSSEPLWNDVEPGGTVIDGTVTWQDVASTMSPFWLSTTPSFNEVSTSGTAYTRVEYANTTTNFPAPSGSTPTSGTNANIINFPTSTAAWGIIPALTLHSAATAGSVIAFMYLSKHIVISASGSTPSIPALTGIALSLA
jgi:hypothetical protein